MHSNPNAMLMLADSRCRELLDEAARLRLNREAYGNGPTEHLAIPTAGRQLGVTIGRVLQHLESVRCAISLTSRRAFSR